MKRKGMLVIISGPSGAGKGTVVKKLEKDDYALSISMTTREKRPQEVDGKDYFFCTKEIFIELRDNGQLLEHAEFVGNMYGTPKRYVEEQIADGKAVILEIDVIGALQVKAKFEDSVLIFLMPPTLEELSQRLINRKTENKETIKRRLKRSEKDLEYIKEYNYLVINDEISDAVSKIHTIIDSEYLKPHRNLSSIENFKGDDFDVASFLLRVDEYFE